MNQSEESAYPRPQYGHGVLRVEQPKKVKDALLNSYILEDGGDGYPAVGLSTQIGQTWYRILLPYSSLQKGLEAIETEIDRQRGLRAEVPSRG